MSDKLRVGLIGCGGISGGNVSGYLKNKDLAGIVAVCDVVRERAEKRAKEANADYIYTDYKELLANSELDAVDITLPHYLHYPVALAALEAHKHVLVQKPMACSVADAKTLIKKADDVEKVLMVVETERYQPNNMVLKWLLDHDALGEVYCAITGFQQNIADPKLQTSWNVHWLKQKAIACGGVVTALTIHNFYLLRWFLGEVRRVCSYNMISPVVKTIGMDCEDTAMTILEFVNGAVATVLSFYGAMRQPWGYMMELYGTKGVYSGKLDEVPSYDTPECKGFEKQFEGKTVWELLIREYIDSIREKREPRSGARNHLKTLQVIDAIYRSAETKQSVTL